MKRFGIALCLLFALALAGCTEKKPESTQSTESIQSTESVDSTESIEMTSVSQESHIDENEAMTPTAIVVVTVGDRAFTVDLDGNSSAEAFYEKLKEDPVKVEMHDYGNFEKVGDLPWELPRNDKEITTEPGDLILYQGNQITVYYAENTWNFKRLGRLNAEPEEILEFFGGKDDITAEFWLEWTE